MTFAVVTGASRGLGKEVARALRTQGHEVLGLSRDVDRAANTATEIGSSYETVDFTDIGATRATAERVLAERGVPDVVVIAHGVMCDRTAKTFRTTDSEWRRVMSVNLDSVFTLTSVLGSAMYEARKGRIVIFSACLGRMSGPGNAGGLAPYRISKAGVNSLVRNLAFETGHGARGFLIDAVCPNHSRTDMGGPDAPRSAEEGAETAVWLATREFAPGDTTGVLWEDREILPW